MLANAHRQKSGVGATTTGSREAGARLLKGVLDLCTSLRVPCVAEHIERPEQLDDVVAALVAQDEAVLGPGEALPRP